jgi:hypothetical protein
VRRVLRPWLLPAALLVCLIPFYWISFWVPAVGLYHDDGVYLVTAKALAEGKGYRIISLPDEPRQTKYPPGFPVLLAAVWKMFPDFPANVPVLKLVPVAALLAWLGMGALFARRWGKLSVEATLWLVFICAGTTSAILLSTTFMSDLLFGALVLAALHFLLKVEESERPVRTALAAAMVCAAAYFVRSAAIAVMAGGFIALMAARRIRPALVFAAVSGLALGIWTIWQHSVPVPSNAIERYYSAANYWDLNLLTGHFLFSTSQRVVFINILGLLAYPLQAIFQPDRLLLIFALPLGWASWAAYLRGSFRSPALRLANISFGIYLAMMLLYAWNTPQRFLLPFLPLLLTVACIGLPRFPGRILLGPGAAAMIFFTLLGFVRYEKANGVPVLWEMQWTSADALATWIKDNAPPDSVVLADYDPALYLYTGRKAIRAFAFDNLQNFYGLPRSFESKEEEFRAAIERTHARYILRAGSNGDEPDFQRLIDNLRQEGKATEVRRVSADYAIYEIGGDATGMLR